MRVAAGGPVVRLAGPTGVLLLLTGVYTQAHHQDVPKTPIRAIRIADDLWHAALDRAAKEGEESDGIRRALDQYVTKGKK